MGEASDGTVNSFNPRARVGRDSWDELTKAAVELVSIHAPAWGATNLSIPNIAIFESFNPRARVGRDLKTALEEGRHPYGFNPRARVGRDKTSFTPLGKSTAVSIHAPAWGATSINRCCYTIVLQFQSTRPRGARLPITSYPDITFTVSIHAPAWGATQASH